MIYSQKMMKFSYLRTVSILSFRPTSLQDETTGKIKVTKSIFTGSPARRLNQEEKLSRHPIVSSKIYQLDLHATAFRGI